MTGAFAVIKDVPKMLVYALARDRNERAGRALIPDAVIEKPPSAELRPDQLDSDSLPDYAELDPIVEGYVEGDLSIGELEAAGYDADTVRRIARPRRPQRVQAPAGAARACACRRRRSARTAACRSPTAGPADRPTLACRGSGRRRALVVAALLYGITFPLVKDALDDITPFAYLVGRFTVATLILAPVWCSSPVAPSSAPTTRRVVVRAGLVAGVLLFGGYAAQTVGLQYTTPSTSAFVTGLYVVITPVIESVLRRRLPPPAVVLGLVLATVGLALLTDVSLDLGRGVWLTLLCAVLFACHIVFVGATAPHAPPLPFTDRAARGGRRAVRAADRCRRRRDRHRVRGVRGRVHRDRVLGRRAAAAGVGPAPHPGHACRADPPGRAGVRGHRVVDRRGAPLRRPARRRGRHPDRHRRSRRSARAHARR